MNSRQTFSQNAHEADWLSPPPPSLCCILYSIHPSPLSSRSPPFSLSLSHRPLHQPSSLCITICLIFSPSLSLPPQTTSTSPLRFLSPLFLLYPCSLPTVSPVLRILTHMARFDDHSHHGQTPSTCVTSLSLNYPLISTAGGAVYLKPAPASDRQITPHVTLCTL